MLFRWRAAFPGTFEQGSKVLTQTGPSRLGSWKSRSIIDKGRTDITQRQWGSCFPSIISYSADLQLTAQQNQHCRHISRNTICMLERQTGDCPALLFAHWKGIRTRQAKPILLCESLNAIMGLALPGFLFC